MSERAGGALLVTCAVCVRGIFDDDQLVFFGDGHDGIHVRRLACEMDWNDRPGARTDLLLKVFEVNCPIARLQ